MTLFPYLAMAPPKFDDLGKEAKDLINKNFHFGTIKVEGKTKAKNGVVCVIMFLQGFMQPLND